MGKDTQLAIYQYQQAFGLPIDGKPSTQLLQSIRSQAVQPTPAQSRALTKDDVIEIQQHLTQMGFAPGDNDGVVDSRLESAIYAYQREFDLTPADGQPSVMLLSSLRSNNSAASSPAPSNLPPIRVPMASNLRRAEKTLYYECEKDLNDARQREGLPEIRLISRSEAQADEEERQQKMISEVTRNMLTQGGTAGLGVPEGKSYLEAMADQSNKLVAQQIARGNARVQDMANLQQQRAQVQAAQLEIQRCAAEKAN